MFRSFMFEGREEGRCGGRHGRHHARFGGREHGFGGPREGFSVDLAAVSGCLTRVICS